MDILDLLFPKRCVGCGRVGQYMCADCMNMVRVVGQVCPMCNKGSMWGVVHSKCKARLGMDGLVRVFGYKGVVRRMVTKIKYKLVSDMVDELVEAMVSVGELSPLGQEKWLVVAVPLHKNRQRWRGFNQADELARRVAGYGGWEYGGGVLVRKVDTKPQVGLSAQQRRRNVVGAFGLGNKLQVTSNKKPALQDQIRVERGLANNFGQTQGRVERGLANNFGQDQGEQDTDSNAAHANNNTAASNAAGVECKMAASNAAVVGGQMAASNAAGVSNELIHRNVLLVDDVWTTGTTMRECAKVLKRAGVVKVWGLVAAG